MMQENDYSMRWGVDCGYESMLTNLLDEMSVKQIVEYLAELTDNTVVLYTINGSHVFSARESSETRSLLSMLLRLLNQPEAFEKFMAENQTQRIPTVYDTVFIDCYGEGVPMAVTAELVVDGEFIGRVFSFALEEENQDENIKLLKIFSNVLGQKIAASFSSPVTPVQDDRAASDINSGTKWLRKLSGDTFQNFYILAIEEKAHWSDQDMFKQILDQHNYMFRRVISDGYLTILFNLRSNDELSLLQELANTYCQRNHCYAGLSFRFHTTVNIRNGFLQAVEAIKTAKYLNQDPQLCDFEFLSVGCTTV